MENNSKCTIIRVLLFDVLIPLIRFGLLIYSVVQLFQNGDPNWAIATIGAILAPGILEVIYWLVLCCTDPESRNSSEPWKYIVFFNPITFPISAIGWHLWALFDMSVYESYFSTSLVLNSLQSFTESAAITLLQLVIIITTWNKEYTGPTDVVSEAIHAFGQSTNGTQLDKYKITRYVQIASFVLAVIGLAKDYSRHHFFELSGKEKVPAFWISFKALLFYIAFIFLRIPSLVLLALFFRQYFFIILLVFVLVNISISICVLGRNVYKSIWTGFSAVLAPTCFVAKADLPTFSHPGKSFYKFYLFNALAFLAITISAHLLADIFYGLRANISTEPNIDIVNFLLESFDRIPFLDLKCEPNYAGCPYVLSTIATSCTIAEIILLIILFTFFREFLGSDLPVLNGL